MQVPEEFATPEMTELLQELELEMEALRRDTPSRVPALDAEIAALEEQIRGWGMSLAKPALEPLVREMIEQDLNAGLRRKLELERDLEMERRADDQGRLKIDFESVRECLSQLADVLAGENATQANIELALHIDQIACFPDDRVRIRTCKLGALAGATDALREDDAGSQEQPPTGSPETGWQAKPRRRGRRVTSGKDSGNRDMEDVVEFSTDPNRFSGLPGKWFYVDEFQVARRISWVEEHAEAVAAYQKQHECSTTKLMNEFRKSRPTILKALRIAESRRRNDPVAPTDTSQTQPNPGADELPSQNADSAPAACNDPPETSDGSGERS